MVSGLVVCVCYGRWVDKSRVRGETRRRERQRQQGREGRRERGESSKKKFEREA